MKIGKDKIPLILLALLFSVALAALFYKHIMELNFIQDDSYTVFRYVKNFLAGKGLVFNPSERVEGYTNFL